MHCRGDDALEHEAPPGLSDPRRSGSTRSPAIDLRDADPLDLLEREGVRSCVGV